MIDRDSQTRWTMLAAMLLICFAKTGPARAQSIPTSPPESAPELTFNFSDRDTDRDFNSESIESTTAPPTPIHWNWTDQRSLDQCQRDARLARAGHPLSISKRAATTYNQKYEGYYVGGGVPPARFKNRSRGEPRYRDEGTWGMDYSPFFTRVAANWSHGRLFQGGIGQYEPDHKNRPFGQTFGKHFGNRDRRFETAQHAEILHSESWSAVPILNGDR